jgi:microcystin-dependent protein
MKRKETMMDKRRMSLRLLAALVGAGVVGIGAWVYASVPHTFAPGETLTANNVNGNFLALDQRLTALESLLPAGTIVAYGGPAATAGGATTIPTGWLLCDGSAVSRATYAALFSAIGINFGSGDGINTFNLPDLRGRFARGADHGAGNDPDAATRAASNAGGPSGDNVGTVQSGAFKSHDHGGQTGMEANFPNRGLWYDAVTETAATGAGLGMTDTVVNGGSHTHPIAAQGGSETRPVNISVNYMVKS